MTDFDWHEGLRLRMAAAGHSARSLSLAAGLSPTAVRDIVTGRSRRPRYQTLYRLAQVLGCTPEALRQPPEEADLAGLVPPHLRQGDVSGAAPPLHPRAQPRTGTTAIPVLEADAFESERPEDETPQETLGLPQATFERLGAREPLCLRVTEDAMAPSITPGDLLLLDRAQTRLGEDGLYVLLRREQLIVRRLQIDPVRETVSVLADNPRYAPLHDIAPDELRIFGRVLWQGRTLT